MKKYVIAFIIFMFICPFLCTKIIYGAESNEDLSAKVEAMEKMLIELRGQLKQQTVRLGQMHSPQEYLSLDWKRA